MNWLEGIKIFIKYYSIKCFELSGFLGFGVKGI